MTALEELGLFADIPVSVEVELDRMTITINQILSLEEGIVLKTGRSAGENVDIRVGDALLGFGEIVVMEERLGIRITDFVSEE